MQFAYDYNDVRVFIDDSHSNQDYYCPYCGAPLIKKNGQIRQHHFAHRTNHLCTDTWERNGTYDKSPWHNDWQNIFPRNNQEVKLQLGETIHRADVMVGRTVIEFQHSIIPAKTFDDRNNFYLNLGYKVIWLFDLTDLVDNGQITYTVQQCGLTFHWNNPKRAFTSYDVKSGCIDLFFQINRNDEHSIVRVIDTSSSGFEIFYAANLMSKNDFLEYVGLIQGNCAEPERYDIDSNHEYLEFREKYHIVLNKQQERALQAIEGANLLLAVPGSGKTTVLVERLGFMLLVKKISPQNILALTFNKQAALEMKKRFANQFGVELSEQLQIRTIHSFANEIYLSCRDAEKRAQLDLIKGKEKREIIKSVCTAVYPNTRVTENNILTVQTIVTYIKNMMLSPEQIKEWDTDFEKWSEIYQTYHAILKDRKKMDYDDQLVFANVILEKRPQILSELRERYRYICVDEAQDTSKIQHHIIQQLAVGNNLFMVGDEDQSIYGFRAAYPKALLNFRYDYKNPYIMRMEHNYRSTSQIVDKAQAFISQNKGRYEKNMVSVRGPGEDVQVVPLKNRVAQYKYLLEVAKATHTETAFLYRDNETAPVLVDLLLRNHISFTLKKPEMNFFACKTFLDIIAYLTLALNPYAITSFSQIVNKGILYLKKETQKHVVQLCLTRHITVFEALDEIKKECSTDKAIQTSNFQEIMIALISMEPVQAIDVLCKSGYQSYLIERNMGLGSVEPILMLAEQEKTLLSFLQHLKELEDKFKKGFDDAEKNLLILSTIHSSKGLEYDTVYLVDVFDGRLPSSRPDDLHRSKDNSNGEQEERRLFYVGMTRAKNKLVLPKLMDRPSCFIDSLFPNVSGNINRKTITESLNTNIRHKKNVVSNRPYVTYDSPRLDKKIKRRIFISSKEDELKQCYAEVSSKFTQQEKQIRDHTGRRWVKCEVCGNIKPDYEFSVYGGMNKVNLGKCRECYNQEIRHVKNTP